MELLKNLEGLSADEQMTAVVELQKAAMKHLEEQKQASIGKSAELVIQGLKKIKSDFEAKFDSLNYDIQTKVASLKDGEQGLQGPKGDQGERGLDGANGRDGRDGKDGKDGVDGVDGVGVRDAKIDFDGSLVISLTDGREINCGEVVSVDVAKQIQKVTHNIQTGSGGDSQTVLDAIAAIQATIATYGTMATQNKTSVDIEGGTIDNTTIGATTPSTGVFTTLTGNTSVTTPIVGAATGSSTTGLDLNVNSKAQARVVEIGDGTRPLVINGGSSGGSQSPGISAPVNLHLSSGTSARVIFYTNGRSTTQQAEVSHTASAVNYVQVTGGATGASPTISAQGSDAVVSFAIRTKGTGSNITPQFDGSVYFQNLSSQNQFRVFNTASAVNYLQTGGSTAGSGLAIQAAGSDTNIDLNLTTKGTGVLNLNTGAGTQVRIIDSGSTAVNRIHLQGQGTGFLPIIASRGSDTNLGMSYSTQGTGGHDFYTAGTNFTQQVKIAHTSSAVNYVQVTGAATGANVAITSQGSDANIGLDITAKGGGFVRTGGWLRVGISSANFLQLASSSTGFGPVISSVGSDTNIPLVLQPAGTGALQAQQTDSTATGGNARGANAVDWQTTRGAAGQVASGTQSVVGGGFGNTASSVASTIVGGASNVVNQPYGGILSGQLNSVTLNYASVVGGYSNTGSGFYGFVGGGTSNSTTSSSAVTTQSATMNGTTAVTLSASNANIKVGQFITGTSIAFPNTYVAAISGTSLTLSQAASGSSTSTLSFYTPHGVVVGGGNNQATGAYSFIGGGGDAGTAGNRNVASGDWSVVGGGVKNTAIQAYTFIGGGNGNVASSSYSTVSGGSANGIYASYGTIAGGLVNAVTGFGASVVGGYSNSASGSYSVTGAGSFSTTRGINSMQVISGDGPISGTAGSAQSGLLILGRQTTDATATRLASDGNAAGTTNQVILPNNSAYYFRGEVISGVTGGGNTKGWYIEGVIKRGANAASTTLVGSTVTSSYADAGASTWTIAVTADTTNGGLAVTFTGQAATTIRTVAQIRTTEMTY